MKRCNSCGARMEEDVKLCPHCGSSTFKHICPNCTEEYIGSYCPGCGTKYNAIPKTCPNCSNLFFTRSCPNCGYNPVKARQEAEQASLNRNGKYRVDKYGTNTKKSMMLSIVGLCIFPPLCIAGLVYAIRGKNDNEPMGAVLSSFIISGLGCFQMLIFIIVMIIMIVESIALRIS